MKINNAHALRGTCMSESDLSMCPFADLDANFEGDERSSNLTLAIK